MEYRVEVAPFTLTCQAQTARHLSLSGDSGAQSDSLMLGASWADRAMPAGIAGRALLLAPGRRAWA